MSDYQDNPEKAPVLDETVAQQVLGKRVLIGITYLSPDPEA